MGVRNIYYLAAIVWALLAMASNGFSQETPQDDVKREGVQLARDDAGDVVSIMASGKAVDDEIVDTIRNCTKLEVAGRFNNSIIAKKLVALMPYKDVEAVYFSGSPGV